jgi:hypothetical protein
MFIAITELRQQSHLAGGFLNTTLCGGLRSASAPPYLQAPHLLASIYIFSAKYQTNTVCEVYNAKFKFILSEESLKY